MIRPGMRVRLKDLPYGSHGVVVATVDGEESVIVRWAMLGPSAIAVAHGRVRWGSPVSYQADLLEQL